MQCTVTRSCLESSSVRAPTISSAAPAARASTARPSSRAPSASVSRGLRPHAGNLEDSTSTQVSQSLQVPPNPCAMKQRTLPASSGAAISARAVAVGAAAPRSGETAHLRQAP